MEDWDHHTVHSHLFLKSSFFCLVSSGPSFFPFLSFFLPSIAPFPLLNMSRFACTSTRLSSSMENGRDDIMMYSGLLGSCFDILFYTYLKSTCPNHIKMSLFRSMFSDWSVEVGLSHFNGALSPNDLFSSEPLWLQNRHVIGLIPAGIRKVGLADMLESGHFLPGSFPHRTCVVWGKAMKFTCSVSCLSGSGISLPTFFCSFPPNKINLFPLKRPISLRVWQKGWLLMRPVKQGNTKGWMNLVMSVYCWS